ncbi:hypothetical protein SFUMM280S_10784 [Streptomyces fumanus]
MPVKVSVIVPVYNPGTCIEDCIASLQRQSLPPEEYEVVFVDDGSTDATPATRRARRRGPPDAGHPPGELRLVRQTP